MEFIGSILNLCDFHYFQIHKLVLEFVPAFFENHSLFHYHSDSIYLRSYYIINVQTFMSSPTRISSGSLNVLQSTETEQFVSGRSWHWVLLTWNEEKNENSSFHILFGLMSNSENEIWKKRNEINNLNLKAIIIFNYICHDTFSLFNWTCSVLGTLVFISNVRQLKGK